MNVNFTAAFKAKMKVNGALRRFKQCNQTLLIDTEWSMMNET